MFFKIYDNERKLYILMQENIDKRPKNFEELENS
jgi:hypothetical protein